MMKKKFANQTIPRPIRRYSIIRWGGRWVGPDDGAILASTGVAPVRELSSERGGLGEEAPFGVEVIRCSGLAESLVPRVKNAPSNGVHAVPRPVFCGGSRRAPADRGSVRNRSEETGGRAGSWNLTFRTTAMARGEQNPVPFPSRTRGPPTCRRRSRRRRAA